MDRTVILALLGVISNSSVALAAPASGGTANLASFLPMMLIFIVGAYFLMIRPQNKRAKAQRKMLSEITKGDEVITIGGIAGKIAKINDDFVSLAVNDNVEITIQKSAISNVLPKGTLKGVAN